MDIFYDSDITPQYFLHLITTVYHLVNCASSSIYQSVHNQIIYIVLHNIQCACVCVWFHCRFSLFVDVILSKWGHFLSRVEYLMQEFTFT